MSENQPQATNSNIERHNKRRQLQAEQQNHRIAGIAAMVFATIGMCLIETMQLESSPWVRTAIVALAIGGPAYAWVNYTRISRELSSLSLKSLGRKDDPNNSN